MNQLLSTQKPLRIAFITLHYMYLCRAFFAGALLPFGFAPFHMPGLSVLGIALLFAQLRHQTLKQSFLTGFVFGLGFLGVGVSWVFVSIHAYGHLDYLLSALITLLFVVYLALYPALVAALYSSLSKHCSFLGAGMLFSALWCLGEYLRSTFIGGFPWLLLGFGQIDAPLGSLLPIIGVYGVSFLTCLAGTLLIISTQHSGIKRYIGLAVFVALLITPSFLKNTEWTQQSANPLSVGIIQANLSMRDKWDEALFWRLLEVYQKGIEQLMGEKKLIVLPESAIPLPASYVSDILDTIHQKASRLGSSVLLGIPEPTSTEETYYYNSLISLGDAKGRYLKQHLVPFGEFIPEPFSKLIHWLGIPSANLKPGKRNQPLIQVHDYPIASLICYELAYPELLRQQLPEAAFIVSISDDGWFGHSLAVYQQLQIAQVLSLQTGRYQVVANNDGLSSIINTQGAVIASLPAFSAGVLESTVYPATGITPWVYWGDWPALLVILSILLMCFWMQIKAKRPSRFAKMN